MVATKVAPHQSRSTKAGVLVCPKVTSPHPIPHPIPHHRPAPAPASCSSSKKFEVLLTIKLLVRLPMTSSQSGALEADPHRDTSRRIKEPGAGAGG